MASEPIIWWGKLIGYTLRVYQWIRVRMTPFGRGNMYYEPAILECIKSSQRVNNRELQWYRSYPALPQVNAVVRKKQIQKKMNNF